MTDGDGTTTSSPSSSSGVDMDITGGPEWGFGDVFDFFFWRED